MQIPEIKGNFKVKGERTRQDKRLGGMLCVGARA